MLDQLCDPPSRENLTISQWIENQTCDLRSLNGFFFFSNYFLVLVRYFSIYILFLFI